MTSLSHIVEPVKLLLTWQPRPDREPRTRRVVGEVVIGAEGEFMFRYLSGTEDFTRAREAGFVDYPAFNVRAPQVTQGVIEALLRRLPPRNREDFDRYLQLHRLPTPFKFSDFALLGYTGAQLPGDGFSLVPMFPLDVRECEFITEVAGVRHVAGANASQIKVGDALTLARASLNPVDPDAIHVLRDGHPIGFINRAIRLSFNEWMKTHDISMTVDRLNGTPDRPMVYAWVRVCIRAAQS